MLLAWLPPSVFVIQRRVKLTKSDSASADRLAVPEAWAKADLPPFLQRSWPSPLGAGRRHQFSDERGHERALAPAVHRPLRPLHMPRQVRDKTPRVR